MKPRMFLVVGHSHWGKSRTLRALTGGRLLRSITIGGANLHIRRMSNDDRPEELEAHFRHLANDGNRDAISALCPKLTGADQTAADLLDILTPTYEILFWVQQRSFRGDRFISSAEVAAMKSRGVVHVYDQHGEALDRARDLRAFIESQLRNQPND